MDILLFNFHGENKGYSITVKHMVHDLGDNQTNSVNGKVSASVKDVNFNNKSGVINPDLFVFEE